MGFAKMASEKYAHIPSSGAWRKPAGDLSSTSMKYAKFQSTTQVRDYFQSLTFASYVRLSSVKEDDYGGNGGTHSIVVGLVNNSSIRVYDCNWVSPCEVGYRTWTMTQMLNYLPYRYLHISHHFDGTKYESQSATKHRNLCTTSDCVAYVVEDHIFVTSAGITKCSKCGYIKAEVS